MVVAGIILLLPGLCAIIFGTMMLSQAHVGSDLVSFVAAGLMIGFFGLIMIWAAIRSPKP